MSPWQVRGIDARPEQVLGAARPLEGGSQLAVELRHILRGAVGQPTVALTPDVLSRVEFRGVRREVLRLNPGVLAEERLHGLTPMDRALVPEQDQRAAEVSQELPEEPADIQPIEAAALEPDVQRQTAPPGRDRQRTDGGDVALFVEIPGMRGVPSGCPGALKVGDEQEAALVEENQVSLSAIRVFLYAATESASSGRWPARPVGGRAAPAAESSSPCRAATTTHGWGGTTLETFSESRPRCAPASTDRSGTHGPARPPRGWSPRPASGLTRADRGVPGWDAGAAPWLPSSGRSSAIETPNSWRTATDAPLPTDADRMPAGGWPVGAAAPTAGMSLGVSCPIGYPCS